MSVILLAEHSPPTACKRVVSGTISLPSQGFFSPFPHGTGSLSVASEYLALPVGPGRFKQARSVACAGFHGAFLRGRSAPRKTRTMRSSVAWSGTPCLRRICAAARVMIRYQDSEENVILRFALCGGLEMEISAWLSWLP